MHFVVVTFAQYFTYATFGFTRPGDTGGRLGELDYAGTGGVAGLEAMGGASSPFHGVHGCWGFDWLTHIILLNPGDMLIQQIPVLIGEYKIL